MTNVITTRLTGSIEKDLDIVAKAEYLDKSTVVRRLLIKSLSEWKKEHSINLYKEGKFSGEQAAKFAEISLWEFFDLLKEKKVPLNYDLEEFERELRNIKWKRK